MKTLSLVLAAALVVAGAAYGRSWLDSDREKQLAVAAFEAFYWKLQKNDLAAASALVVPGSEAELALAVESEIGAGGATATGVARGFALDVSHEVEGEYSGRPVIHLRGQATVNVDPAGYRSPFGVAELHEVEARLVEDAGSWRVAAFRDLRQ
jgi:hypothetical protein